MEVDMPDAQVNPDAAESDVLVIGAGPAGLAVSACLIRRGLRPQVIEKAASVGASWHAHYRRLHLHTVSRHSALPFMPFPAGSPRYVPRQQVADYLESYARHFEIVPRFGQEVVAITRRGEQWETLCRSGARFVSRCVVVATGANNVPNVPTFAGQQDYRGELMHSRGYRDATPFAGKRVLVVGMGNTGAEIALDLAERGVDVALSVRSPVNVVHRDVLGRPTQVTSMLLARLPTRIGDAVARMLRDLTVGDLGRYGISTSSISPLRQLREEGRTPVIDVGTLAMIKRGKIAVRPGIESFTVAGVRFVDGRSEPCDAVILATGYRPALGELFPGVRLEVHANGMPPQPAGTGPLAGVFFVGFDVRQPGGLLRTIGMQAMEVAAQVARRDAARTPVV
jgi:cation diffusion facilitator CzcD-associated flavoprotein CzcO